MYSSCPCYQHLTITTGPTSTVPLGSDSRTWSWCDGNYSIYSMGLDIDEIPGLLAMCP